MKGNWRAAGVAALGVLNMLGYAAGWPAVSSVARVTSASPLPVVFNDMAGLEPYALDLELLAATTRGDARRYLITPEWCAKLRGPFVRRHAYLRLMSEAPRKSQPLWYSVLRYGFCDGGPLAREAGIEEPLHGFILRLHSRTAGRPALWDLPVSCRG